MNIKNNKIMNRTEFEFNNNKGETIKVWIYKQVNDLRDKKSLMNIWAQKGYLKQPLEAHWWMEVHTTNKQSNEFNCYNPCIIPNTTTINFNYILPATKDNLKLLLNKCQEMANS